MKNILKTIFQRPHQAFLKYYEERRFDPQLSGLFINPFYFARRGLYSGIRAFAPRLTGTILDVGCGTEPYRDLFTCERYDGLEIDTERTRTTSSATHFYDGSTLPFADSSYDSVLCNQVLEHVFEPDEFLGEIHRVLKTRGQLLLTVPFVWDEHEQPHDFARYSSFGLEYLLKKHGFTIVESHKSIPTIAVIFQLLNGYLYKKTKTKSLYINLIVTFFLMAPWNILGTVFSWLLPLNEDLYLDNIILVQKV